MAEEVKPGTSPEMGGSDPFTGVAPLDPGKIKSEAGQDAAPGAGTTPADEAPQNYFNPGAPVEEEAEDKPAEAKVEDGTNDQPDATKEPQAQDADAAPETPEKDDVTPDEGTTTDWEQNYKELRTKFNQRDDEMKDLRGKVKEFDSQPNQSEELKTQLTDAKSTLKEYEKWYQENYPVFKRAVEDPKLASKLKEIQKELAQPLTSDQVRQISLETQQEGLKKDQQTQLIDSFVDGNNKAFSDPLVRDRFEKEIKRYPDGYEIDQITLDIAFEKAKRSVGYKEEEVKAKATKSKEELQKKVANAQVGQGTTNTPPATPPNNQKRSLFAPPPGNVSSAGMFGQG